MRTVRTLVVLAALAAPCTFTLAEETPAAESAPAPVDYRRLKELLPETVLDLKRTDARGEKIKMGEMVLTQATATYEKEGDEVDNSRVELAIFDYAGMKGAGDMFAAFAQMEVDREGDDGFERTLKIQDQPAHEQYRNDGGSGQIQIWVAGRYLVTFNASKITADQIKKLEQAVDVKKLAETK